MRVNLVVFAGCILLLTAFLPAQSPASLILQANGDVAVKSLKTYELQGTVKRADGTSLPFSLKVQGENSRFETSEAVSIHNGWVQQWWKQGGKRSRPGYSLHGAQDVFLSPLFVLSQLDKYQFRGRDKVDRFSCQPKYERFLNFNPGTPVIDLEFHPDTHRLSAIVFYHEENPVAEMEVSFSDYRQFGRFWLPSRVTQFLGERPLAEFEVTSVTFDQVFSSSLFAFEK
jgi:hypothetical protein